MAGDGTEFVIDIGVNGASGAEAAARAVTALADKLTAAGSASDAAAQAVKAGEAAYRQAENAADRAAKAVEKIGIAAEAQRGKMKAAMDAGDATAFWRAAAAAEKLGQRQAEAATKSAAAKAALDAEAISLDKLRAAATAASAAESKVAKAHEAAKKTADTAAKAQAAAAGTGKLTDIAGGLGALGGPLGTTAQKALMAGNALGKLSQAVGSGGPYAIAAVAAVALAAGITAIAAAAVAATAAVWKWAVSLADAARSNDLLVAGIAKSVKGGQQLASAIDDISGRLPLTASEIQALAPPLVAAGLKGKALTDALEAAAEKAAKTKYGPEFMKQMNSLPMLATRLQKNFARIFGGLKIEALLENLGKVVALFDANSASANAMKAIFESVFQPITDGVTEFIPKLIAGFIQFEIWVMRAMIAIKPWGSTILLAAKIVGGLALVIGGALAIALGIVIASVTMLAVGFGLLVAAALAVIAAFVWVGVKLGEVGQSIVDFFKTVDLAQMGSDLIDGLIKGITGGADAVVKAMGGVVTGAIDSAKNLLGIASPSKVFAEIGGYTAEGMAVGVDDGAGDVQASMQSMVEPPPAEASGGGEAGASAASGGTFYLTFQISGGDPQENAKSARDQFVDFLESIGVRAGTAVPA